MLNINSSTLALFVIYLWIYLHSGNEDRFIVLHCNLYDYLFEIEHISDFLDKLRDIFMAEMSTELSVDVVDM